MTKILYAICLLMCVSACGSASNNEAIQPDDIKLNNNSDVYLPATTVNGSHDCYVKAEYLHIDMPDNKYVLVLIPVECNSNYIYKGMPDPDLSFIEEKELSLPPSHISPIY